VIDFKNICGAIAVILAFGCYVPYYVGIFRGNVKPHPYTYLVWVITIVITSVASWKHGGGASSWNLIATTFLVLGVFILSFKYGTGDITRFDLVCLILALAAVLLWVLTDAPALAVIFATVVETLSFFPTFRKTWWAPDSESALSWFINTFKHTLSVAAVSHFSITTALYPGVLVFLNFVLVVEILYRRRTALKTCA
jgi:hypothetical protein